MWHLYLYVTINDGKYLAASVAMFIWTPCYIAGYMMSINREPLAALLCEGTTLYLKVLIVGGLGFALMAYCHEQYESSYSEVEGRGEVEEIA